MQFEQRARASTAVRRTCLFTFSQNLTSDEKDIRSKIFSVQIDWRTSSIASCNALVRECCQEKRVNVELDFNYSKRVVIFLAYSSNHKK